MDLLRWVAEGSNIFGLMVYSAGMILIVGALTWASLPTIGGTTKSQARTNSRHELCP